MTIYFHGGLGNQLFQFAAGLWKSQNLKTTLSYNYCGISRELRRNKIGIWQCKWIISDTEYVFEQNCPHRIHIRQTTMRITYKIINLLDSSLIKSKQHRSKVYGADSEFEKKAGIEHQFGYYQTANYVEKIKEDLGNIVIETRYPTKWYREFSDQIESSEKMIVGLHIRRSDYLQNMNGIGLLNFDYFKSICEELDSDLGLENQEILVFTDDEVEVRDHFYIDKMRIVKTPDQEPPINVMLLLARCDVLVLSNSTFSWWSAYIGQSQFKLKRVISPEPWFKGTSNPIGIYRKSWERRPSTWENSDKSQGE